MTITEGPLYWDPVDPALRIDPYPIWRRLRDEAPNWAIALPKLPRLVEQALAHQAAAPSADLTVAILAERRRTNRLLILIAFMLVLIAIGLAFAFIAVR